ncbi:hypothetical protein [Micromonospora sp. NBS 11-29]|uniref:hypothetical protein n=1 Tax=Micromonospora sp. NBS 11-29 TaxID=1960879 RepID=UPI000B784546|nr:hypothetical protein [Micromonospora sp. NBS 11-29]
MGKHRRTSDDAPQPATEDPGATYWSVTEGDWPAGTVELAGLLAPPIVVRVARAVATSQTTPPTGLGSPGRAPSRSGAVGHPAASGAPTVRLNAGSRPAAPIRRPAAGRHRDLTV